MDVLSAAIARVLQRLEETDRRLARVERALGIASAEPSPSNPKPPPAPSRLKPAPSEAEPPTPSPPPPASTGARPAPAAPRGLETRLGLTWVNRVGVITLALGFAFFFKYAVDNRWIGEAGRVVLGVACGLAALAIARVLWRREHEVFAQGICGAGISILYLSFYAAFGFYHLIPQGLAFLLMALATAAAGILSVRHDALAIAVLGLLGGYATPLLLSTGEDRPWFFFGYVLLLNAGAMAAARLRQWRRLETFAFAATVFLCAAWLLNRFRPETRVVATVYVLIYYALFALVNRRSIFVGSQALAGLALLVIWTPHLNYLFLSLALSAAGMAIAGRRGRSDAAVAVFAAFWILYFAWYNSLVAVSNTAAVFFGLTAAFLLFVSWLPWRMLVQHAEARTHELLLVALGGPFYFAACYSPLEAGYSAVLGLLAVAVASLHLVLAIELRKRQPEDACDMRPVLLCAGVALVFVTLAVPIQFSGYRVTMVWALEAAALSWIGVRAGVQRLVYAALAVFLLTLVRLHTIDAWIVPEPASSLAIWNVRFLVFVVAALCLWAASYWIRTGWPALSTYIAGHTVMLWALSLEVLEWAARTASAENLESMRNGSLSILMALYALALVGIGVLGRSAVNRILGLGLIALAVLKLYLHDVWLLRRIHRIAAFAVLGILLILTSYLYSRFRNSIETWWRKGKANP